jgi:hypothetical protein
MRLQLKVLEGDQVTETLAPLATVLAFKAEHGKPLNEAVRSDDPMDWAPWVTWHSLTHRGQESRSFADWCAAVEWVQADSTSDVLDPSGGDSDSTSSGTGSPESSPNAASVSTTSPDTPTSSKTPSGERPAAA